VKLSPAYQEGDQTTNPTNGDYIGEGFDDALFDTLFLATPVSWKGTLQQYDGRLHRLRGRKRVVDVYDYVDAKVRMLWMYDQRLRGYGDMGYKVLATAQECRHVENESQRSHLSERASRLSDVCEIKRRL